MVWLYKLPNTYIALLFGVIGAALFVGVLFLRVKVLRIQVQSDHAKAAHYALTVMIGFVGDCLHLISALHHGFEELCTFDRHQLAAAQALGLTVLKL